ncbi:hypothetical protein MRS44_010190 [Fusarium solani]|uniref:uncharacterized protein n=1 Tax=Fusarium solani TaxID=169388 RepID=UPI0032C472C2|nr:hypothetical protein MRS44_010190 [Fusarium solani]
MPPNNSGDEDEPPYLDPGPITVDEICGADIEIVINQMVCEIFKLAGRNPADHSGCFQACVQMVKDTDVIHATDFKEWEKHEYIQTGLDNLDRAERIAGSAKPVTFWMINAPLAVAAAAAINQPHIRIQDDSRFICTFNENDLWDWVGCAIDFWSTLSGPIASISTISRATIVHLMDQGKTTEERGLPKCTVYPLQSVTLSLFVHFRISSMANPTGDWIRKQMVSRVLTTRREEAMEKGKGVLAKLGNEHYDQAALREPIDQWLTLEFIHVLPKDVKERLWSWCLQHHSLWQPHIAQAIEDSTEYYEIVQSPEISVCLASHELQRCLDRGRCLVLLLEDPVSRSNLEMIAGWMRKEDGDEHQVFSTITGLRKVMTDDLKAKLSPERSGVQRSQAPLFAGPKDGEDRNALVRIIQQIFDASICVHPTCPTLVDVFLVLLPKVDDTLLLSICADMEKAKQRRALAKENPSRKSLDDEGFSEMATTVNKIDPESLLIAYTLFLIYMRQILNDEDEALLIRCLEPPRAPLPRNRGRR